MSYSAILHRSAPDRDSTHVAPSSCAHSKEILHAPLTLHSRMRPKQAARVPEGRSLLRDRDLLQSCVLSKAMPVVGHGSFVRNVRHGEAHRL